MVDNREHWKKKWIKWWRKWPDGRFPRGTQACNCKSMIKTGRATLDQYEGQIMASLYLHENGESQSSADLDKIDGDDKPDNAQKAVVLWPVN